MNRLARFTVYSLLLTLCLAMTACTSADPNLVAQAVQSTLTAVFTPTPIVIVVTVVGNVVIPTVTAPPSETPVPSETPTPTQAPTDAAAPTATPSPLPQLSLTPPGQLLWSDDFSGVSQWNTGEDSTSKSSIANGVLSITLKTTDRFTFIYNLTRRARDFFAQIDGVNTGCAFRARYGLLFRVRSDGNYYQYEIDCEGRFRLSRVDNGALTPLKDWTANAAIRKGDGVSNQLAVRTANRNLELFANGQSIFKVLDPTYDEGGFGFYAGSGAASQYTANFDNFFVWEVKP
jgi:hypothetical protein